jgi:DNA-nicking Smr family endonuclease
VVAVMTRRRQLSEEDHALWTNVARSIKPLRKSKQTAGPAAEPSSKSSAKSPVKKLPVIDVTPPQLPPGSIKPQLDKAPTLAPLGRRLKKRVARGREPIDAKIDLHGLTQTEAHAALLRFLHRAQDRGARMVLVVTGKGSTERHAERGVLKRQVPMWLALPEFRRLIVGFEDAHIGHGGQGALYVRLRREK